MSNSNEGYRITAEKKCVIAFTVHAENKKLACDYARRAISDRDKITRFPFIDTDFEIVNVEELGKPVPQYVVNPNGNYFVLENFSVNASRSGCYVCPDMDSMHAILKMVFNYEKDEVEDNEIYLMHHSGTKFESTCGFESRVFLTTDIEEWINNFEM